MSIDTLLVNPNNRIVSPFAGIEPPLWAGLIASHYKQQGQTVQILDAEAGDLTVGQTVEAVKNVNPRRILIVVMGNNPSASSTPKMPVTKRLVQELKGYDVAVTGLHPSALPEETEQELGVPVLRGKIFDGMPDMPWELLPMHLYRAHNWHCLDGSPREPYASIYTSLGCPFDCSYCNIHALYGGERKVWFREPKAVLEEIDRLVQEYNIKNIKFWDELFTLKPFHVEATCEGLIKRHYGLNIWAYARVDTVDRDMLALMKKAGINWLAYGFESSSDTVLGEVNKKANKQQAIDVVVQTHKADIKIIGNFIFGLPGDTEETMRETVAFAKSLELEYINFYTAKSYPGSKLYDGNTDWESYNQYGKEVKQFADRAFLEFMTDKAYLKRIEQKFGQQAVDHIDAMLKFGKPTTRG